MSIIERYKEHTPSIAKTAYVAANAAVIGDVVIGEHSSIWYSTVIRGDVMPIRIGDETSIQDGTVIHVTDGRFGTTVGSRVTVGHQAVIHACEVHDGALVGMGAVVLDGAVIGAGALVAAGAVVSPGTKIPPGVLAIGTPARVKRDLTDEERHWLAYSADHYVELTRTYLAR